MSTTTERPRGRGSGVALAALLRLRARCRNDRAERRRRVGGRTASASRRRRPSWRASTRRCPTVATCRAGSGSVAQGKAVYEAQCVACHGENLQGGIGDRLIGGRGTLVNSDPAKAPVKTVESYWPYATTLFDYIKRAMPLTAPDSLSDDQVYALCAYILSRANIVGCRRDAGCAGRWPRCACPTATASSPTRGPRPSRRSPRRRTRIEAIVPTK